MTVKELAEKLQLKTVCMPDPDREVLGGYAGDLLSWVMGRAPSDAAWMTIMSNVNIAAVATLADTACIILAEGVQPDDGVTELACEKNINLLLSDRSAYDTAVWLHERL